MIAVESRFFTIYFNLALAHGLLEKFEECRDWLQRLYGEFPHKRRMIGEELQKRTQLASAMAPHDDVMDRFAEDFPGWFPLSMEAC